MNLSLTPVWLAVYCRPTVCTSGAREWSYIAVPLRPHASLSLLFGCVTRVRIGVCPVLAELQSCSQTDSVVGRFHEILCQNLRRKCFARRVYICRSSLGANRQLGHCLGDCDGSGRRRRSGR